MLNDWINGGGCDGVMGGQYCIYVSDLEAAVRFYETLGLACTSRTDLGHTKEAMVENPTKGGRLQLAQKMDQNGRIEMGNAFWKLYVATTDIERMHKEAVSAGYRSTAEPFRGDQWPMTIAFIEDPDGYQVELTQWHPWTDVDDTTHAWLNQYCIYVSHLERSIAFYELLGLECTSRTNVPARGGTDLGAAPDGRAGPGPFGPFRHPGRTVAAHNQLACLLQCLDADYAVRCRVRHGAEHLGVPAGVVNHGGYPWPVPGSAIGDAGSSINKTPNYGAGDSPCG